VYGRTLDEEETELLLTLLDVALSARVSVSGVTGSAYGVKRTLSPHPESSTVDTVRGRLHLDRLTLSVAAR
jgi:hypothetical protein